ALVVGIVFCASATRTSSQTSQPALWGQRAAPFRIASINFPLLGATYLRDRADLTPLATSIQEMKALGANDVRLAVTAAEYDASTDNLPSPSPRNVIPDAELLTFLQQLKAAG